VTSIAYGLAIGLLVAVAWVVSWTLCARHAFWKMQANYLRASEAEEDKERTRLMQEALDKLHIESAEEEDLSKFPPPPPSPNQVKGFGWARKQRRAS
jgi:hypothetical protein